MDNDRTALEQNIIAILAENGCSEKQSMLILEEILKHIDDYNSNRLEEGWIKPTERLPQKSEDPDEVTCSDDLFFLVEAYKGTLEYCYGYYDTRNERWYDKLCQDREGEYYRYWTDKVAYWRELPLKP